MDHMAISVQLLREDNEALEKRVAEMAKEKEAWLKNQELFEKQIKKLSELNQLQEKRLTEAPPAKPSAEVKHEMEQQRKKNDTLEKNISHLQRDLERVYKRLQDQKAPSTSSSRIDYTPLLKQKAEFEEQQRVVQDLLRQCKEKLKDRHLHKRKRLDNDEQEHETLLKQAIDHYRSELDDEHEFKAMDIAQMTQELDETRSKCAKLEEENNKGRAYVASLQESIQRERNLDATVWQARAKALGEELAQQESAMQLLKNNMQELQDRLAVKEQYLQEQEKGLLEMVKKQANDKLEWETAEAAYQKQIQLLQVELQRRNEELVKKRSSEQSSETEIKRKTAAIEEKYQAEVQHLQDRLAVKEQYLLEQNKDTMAILKKHADELLERDEAETELKKHVQSLEETVVELNSRITESDQHRRSLDLQLQRLSTQMAEKDLAVQAVEKSREDTMTLLKQQIEARQKKEEEIVGLMGQLNGMKTQFEDAARHQSDARESNVKNGKTTMPCLSSQASEELQEFFLAYYDCAETKYQAQSEASDALRSQINNVRRAIQDLLPRMENDQTRASLAFALDKLR
ncbi:unnamed protein product [Aphanomyces euteiches]|uniref:Uncharacterized protein n=1 Tax=Aphanomyces euteiches TaxID=100861 RepID=A0A6G0WEQ1_9STRA|nr:hypothetical protein Ae201684_016539 [Aphanomyces euteiches]KAH9093165.1 hypothetical protein Ae201684P_008825 [Aphanomyces euteiches]